MKLWYTVKIKLKYINKIKMNTQKILLQFKSKKENLLPAAKEIQRINGFVSSSAMDKMANYFNLKKAEVFSAVSFYSELRLEKAPSLVIKVCDGANCVNKQGASVLSQIEQFLGQKAEDEFSLKVEIRRESCFGSCERGPIMEVNGTIFEGVVPEKVDDILRDYV